MPYFESYICSTVSSVKNSMMTYKTIIKGRLEFGTSKSYDKVLKMYQHRVENYYKSDIALEEEEIFDEESKSLNIPRLITQSTRKTWKNTFSLLEYVAQFAVAGNMSLWMTDNGTILHQGTIEPQSDKVAVQSFLRGRELIEQDGQENEAMSALSRAIEKYERHANAYERRGYINLKLKNYKDARYDFSKSIDINPNLPEPHMGRAKIEMLEGNYDKAIVDLTGAVKRSIPLQPIYWQARRAKADCHMALEEFDKAAFELKLITKRKFLPDNPNYVWRKQSFFNYGKVLLEIGEYADSLKAFNQAIEIEKESEEKASADQLLYRGIARQRAGDRGFAKDWTQAAKMGSEEASKLLATM